MDKLFSSIQENLQENLQQNNQSGLLQKQQISQDKINELLSELWKTITRNFLTAVGTDGGYQLDLENKTTFQLTDKLFLCPVKKRK